MLVTIEGTYSNGRIELKETPPVAATSRVIVTFLAERQEDVSKEALRQRALRRMNQGLDLGGPPYPSREELHDRSRR